MLFPRHFPINEVVLFRFLVCTVNEDVSEKRFAFRENFYPGERAELAVLVIGFFVEQLCGKLKVRVHTKARAAFQFPQQVLPVYQSLLVLDLRTS